MSEPDLRAMIGSLLDCPRTGGEFRLSYDEALDPVEARDPNRWRCEVQRQGAVIAVGVGVNPFDAIVNAYEQAKG